LKGGIHDIETESEGEHSPSSCGAYLYHLKDGIRNAAPWSNFTPILRPLDEVLLASWLKRDTLENIRHTKEFVVNIPGVGMEDAVMICARNYPPEVDEFQEAGLRPRPSTIVGAPGIEGCLAWAECTLLGGDH